MARTPSENTAEAYSVLTLSGRTGFRVARVSGNVVRLRCPACSLNAAEALRRRGLPATAQIVGGQWAIVVADQ
jgi:hypothetical protein